MKKLTSILIAASLWAAHGNTDDKDLKLALEGKYQEAFAGFKKRCQNGDGYACGMVGYMMDKGIGNIKKDKQKAIEYYKKGCNLNDADSCTLLGYYEYKKGDIKKAKELLNRGCKLGNKDACNYLNKL